MMNSKHYSEVSFDLTASLMLKQAIYDALVLMYFRNDIGVRLLEQVC